MSQEPAVSNKKLGQLITETVADIQTLIRQQIDLTVSELKESSKRALLSSIYLIAALFILGIAGLLLIIAVAFGFVAIGLAPWLAFICDAGIFVVIAVFLLLMAKRNASKVKGPKLAMDNAQKSINELTQTLTKFDPKTL